MAPGRDPAGWRVTVLLEASVIEGALLDDVVVSGVECEASIVEGIELAGEVMGD